MPRLIKPSHTSNSHWDEISAHANLSSDAYAVLIAEAHSALSQLPSESINTCLTSPPYWSARDYEHPDQIGLEDEVDDYVQKLVRLFRQVRRVLTKEGTAWLNLGDCYLHGCGTIDGQPPPKGWKRNKQLALVPFRLALALEDDGWWIRNVVAWHKPNAMPSSVRDRLTNTWEPVFLLAKSDKYYFNLDAIRVPHRTDDQIERLRAERGPSKGKARGDQPLRQWLNSPRHRATIDGLKEIRRRPNAPDPVELAAYLRDGMKRQGVTIQWVADQLGLPFERTRHYFRTDRIGSRLPPEETWEQLKQLLDLGTDFDDAMEIEVGDNVFRNHPLGRNPGDLVSLSLAGGANASQHFAMMPQSLANWALRATLPPNGICLDPFMGTGTTGLAAIALGGRFVGIDIREDFAQSFVAQFGKRARQPREAQLAMQGL